MKTTILVLLAALTLPAAIVPEVRVLLSKQDFASAEKLVESTRAGGAWTPELIEAHSWLGRGALAAKQFDKALAYSAETRKLSMAALKARKLDAEKRLPIGFGASIEVEGQALAAKGQLSEAIAFLNKELKTYYSTSIRTRIQKNINLLSLVGKPAPTLEIKESVGPNAVKPLASLKGKAVLLFFWAHWCGDCKAQAPILANLATKYGPKGLVIVGPTQRYGYAAGGEDATPAVEKTYIAKVYQDFYATIPNMSAPLSEENFRLYGSSTTPTLVLIDKTGIVRLYNPGKLTAEELTAKIEPLLQ
jgi:thiol-disulfide isomerase/thioredoxin